MHACMYVYSRGSRQSAYPLSFLGSSHTTQVAGTTCHEWENQKLGKRRRLDGWRAWRFVFRLVLAISRRIVFCDCLSEKVVLCLAVAKARGALLQASGDCFGAPEGVSEPQNEHLGLRLGLEIQILEATSAQVESGWRPKTPQGRRAQFRQWILGPFGWPDEEPDETK